MTSHFNFIVIGAGVVGLSTAFQIKKQYPNSKITIVYEQSQLETTSYGSGGFWEPYNVFGTPTDKVNEWGLYSFQHFKECEKLNVPGIRSVQAYNLFHPNAPQEEETVPFWSHIVGNFHEMTPIEQQDLLQNHLGNNIQLAASGNVAYESIIADQSEYLPWLTNQLKAMGKIHFLPLNKKLVNLKDISLHIKNIQHVDMICNCTGFGSYYLKDIKDTTLIPVRGQVVRIKKNKKETDPDIAYTYETKTGLTYILPNHNTIVLGGTAEKNKFNLTVNVDVSNQILRNAVNLLPELKDYEVVNSWVGRRPTRSPLRMEIEESFGGDVSFPPLLHLCKKCYIYNYCKIFFILFSLTTFFSSSFLLSQKMDTVDVELRLEWVVQEMQ